MWAFNEKVGSSIQRESNACEKTLGKPPPVPPDEIDYATTIGENLAKRINSADDEERRTTYDNYWIEKLSCMDKTHTINSKLDPNEIYKIEKRLHDYVSDGKNCPLDRTRVTQCYLHSSRETLKCSRDVDAFMKCVYSHFYQSVRSGDADATKNGKTENQISYAKRFERGY